MSVTILLDIAVKARMVPELKKTLVEMLADTRRFDGCIAVTVIQNADDPGNVVLVQEWQTRKHYETYSNWRASTGMAAAMSEKLSATFSLRYFSRLDV